MSIGGRHLYSLLFVAALGEAAAAESGAREVVGLVYEVPAGCPSRADFVARVTSRANVELVDANASKGRVFTVTINERDAGLVGVLVVRDDAGATIRSVTGSSCHEVAQALALIAALAVDPGPGRRTISGPVGPPALDPKPQPPRFGAGAGVSAGGVLGAAPELVPSVAVFAELLWRRVGRLRVAGRWGRRSSSLDPGAATFTLATFEVDVCPRPLWRRGRLGILACGRAQLGALRGRGVLAGTSQSRTRPWITAGMSGRVGYRIRPRLVAELGLVGSAALVRDRFFFAPAVTIHEVPAVVGQLDFSLRAAIW